MDARRIPPRKDGRVIIHFDYDCFYAAVFEAQTPALKSLPFAVQQKHIIVTCNYEARRRGLHKLQLIRDARRICPDVVIELGEDISRFRDASKELYSFLKAFSWNGKVERLGFDEVWMDVTDIVGYNVEIINRHHLSESFFQTNKQDPTEGFHFDASAIAGHAYPEDYKNAVEVTAGDYDLNLRLRLGSHLALYMRHQLEQHKGYTCTVGIATSKLLSKLAGNLHKPKGQTVLLPPLVSTDPALPSNVTTFMDTHDISKIPGIGYKLAQKLRETLSPNGSKKPLSVAGTRNHPTVNPEMLEKLFRGPGSPYGIGYKIWGLLHGVDDTEVNQAKAVPSQISIEDSYIRLDTMPELLKELTALARSLITRMRVDLLIDDDDMDEHDDGGPVDEEEHPLADSLQRRQSGRSKKWLAHPRTLRLTTRPRNQLQADGTRVRTFKRISHSCPAPSFLYSRTESVGVLADKLVREKLVGIFQHLHPTTAGGWNLSLVNLALTNMVLTAGVGKESGGRDVGGMFRRQEEVLKDFKVTVADDGACEVRSDNPCKNDVAFPAGEDEEDEDIWDAADGGGEGDEYERCGVCGSRMPGFAMEAHLRFHEDGTA